MKTSIIKTPLLIALFFLITACTPSVHDCIAQDKLELTDRLLAEDAERANSLTEKGKTPAHLAVYYKDVPALAMLAKHGADFTIADKTGMTPLHDAAQLWREEETLWLIEHGADVNAKDIYGDTPAHVAAMVNGGPILKILFDNAADLRAQNNNGKTPAELAKEHGHERAALYIGTLLVR